jgi:hypothetical protein
MRTAAAYISKLKAEALGRTFKVQDTNHRLFTTTLYRGTADCEPVDFTQIDYVEVCRCDYIGPAARAPRLRATRSLIDGGSPYSSGAPIVDGGSAYSSGSMILDGGKP